ncbi:HNH endonuclease [Priestia megaterium]|uniref:HNH endonuclease n=1 Tax=Priestia megaterium TaxID=1404 RepID=UPI003242A1F6
MKIPFIVNHEYSRNDIYKILSVPLTSQKGHWNTGYTTYKGNGFIFAGINTTGRTGHDYNNKFIGNDLLWYGNNTSKLHQPSIQRLISSTGDVYIFTRENNNNTKFVYRGNATAKKVYDVTPVKILWGFEDYRENHPEILPEEVTGNNRYKEGSTKKIKVNIYERSSDARQKCLNYYGYKCSVCSFDFKKTYGNIGREFIHVHHLVALHEIGEEYIVNPIDDLRPVCPNCHAMLHRRKPAYTIEELKDIISVSNKI